MPGADRPKSAPGLDCKTPGCQPIIEKAPSILDSLSPEATEHFDSVRRSLDAMGIDYKVDPRLVRGLDYYVRTTFEVLTTELGSQNAVAGGGRYDGLIAQLDGPADPGIGFAIGLERVVLLLGDEVRARAQSPCSSLSARPRCNACCPRRAGPARAVCRWSWVTASGSCPESSSGPIGSARRGR